jgi:hypothetical protein
MPLRNNNGIRIIPQSRTPRELPFEVLNDHAMLPADFQTNRVVPWKNGFRLDGFNLILQEKANWCWAACADMILDFYGASLVTQCRIVNNFFTRDGARSCCRPENNEVCDEGCNKEDIKTVYDRFSFSALFIEESITFQKLALEINAGRPVQVGYKWNSRGFHVAVVIGWRRGAHGDVVFIHDPLEEFAQGQVFFEDLQSAYDRGEWIWTWTNLQRS